MILLFGEYRFDRANQLLSRNGDELPLPPRALTILSRLLDEPGSVVSKQTLLDTAWNGAYVTEASLSEAIGLLREVLRDAPQEPTYIQTVHRRGYRFIAPVRDEQVEEEPAAAPLPPPPRTRIRREVVAGSAALVLLAAGFFIARWTSRRPEPPRPAIARFAVPPLPAHDLVWAVPSLAVSADGRQLVYTATRGSEKSTLFHRDLSGFSSREIPGTRGALLPFFSADGRRVGFHHKAQLMAVPLAGGTPLPLTPVNGFFWGAGWSEDDTVIFSAGTPASLFRARPGGVVEQLTHAAPGGGVTHVWPRILPGGKAVLFTIWSTTLWDARVEWLSLDTGEQHTVLSGASDCRFANGLLVCARAGGTVVAATFDPQRGRLIGPPVPFLRDAFIHPTHGFAQLALGGATLIYLHGTGDTSARTLQRLVDGKPVPLAAPARPYRTFREGPRGAVAATIVDRDRSDVWVLDTGKGTASRLTFGGYNIEPVWSPDGRWIAFASKVDGTFNVHRRRADGSGGIERLVHSKVDHYPLSWSPDGSKLLVRELQQATGFDIAILDLDTRRMQPWQRSGAKEVSAVWSPDGKWIAYCTDETGYFEIYVRAWPHGEGRWQISQEGGEYPTWSADGRTLHFQRRPTVERSAELWAVPVDPAGAELRPGRAARVFSGREMLIAAAGPGGVMLLHDTAPPQKPDAVRVLLDWPSALPPAVTASR